MGILPERPARYDLPRVVDQVPRLEKFRVDHPGVLITSPSQNGTLTWSATWLPPSDPGTESAQQEMRHADLRTLLDNLERQFGGT